MMEESVYFLYCWMYTDRVFTVIRPTVRVKVGTICMLLLGWQQCHSCHLTDPSSVMFHLQQKQAPEEPVHKEPDQDTAKQHERKLGQQPSVPAGAGKALLLKDFLSGDSCLQGVSVGAQIHRLGDLLMTSCLALQLLGHTFDMIRALKLHLDDGVVGGTCLSLRWVTETVVPSPR